MLLVDAGDTFGDGLLANLTRGEATLRLMNALGYRLHGARQSRFRVHRRSDARSSKTMARFPMRAANAVVRATGAPFLGDPTLVVTGAACASGSWRSAYHNTDQTGNKDNTRGLVIHERDRSGAARMCPRCERDADVIVVVSHQGTVVDSVLAARVPGIDIIVGGHSHDRIAPPRRVGGHLDRASAVRRLGARRADGQRFAAAASRR